MLNVRIGDDTLVFASAPDRAGRMMGRVPGELRKMYYHGIGLAFVAWASDEEIGQFIDGAGLTRSSEIADWRESLSAIRQRGYQIVQREPEDDPSNVLIAEMAATSSQGHDRLSRMRNQPAGRLHFLQPPSLEAGQLYEVVMMHAPIFEQEDSAAIVLTLARFTHKLTGEEIENYGEHLLRTCLKVMRDNRTYDTVPSSWQKPAKEEDGLAKPRGAKLGRPRKIKPNS
jgi:DNA-binding IclR family transcriptional regulator